MAHFDPYKLIPIVCRCGRVFYTIQIMDYEAHYQEHIRSDENAEKFQRLVSSNA